MRSHYEIQGRVIQRADGAIVRDEVRLSTSDSHDDATRKARGFVADGFTTWIFMVEPSTGRAPVYQLVDALRPPALGPSQQPSGSGRPVAHHTRLGRVA